MAERFQHPCPTVNDLKIIADFPVLEKWQVAKLIQGFCPNNKVGQGEITWLDDYESEIKLLINAVDDDVLKFPITPAQILIWCVENEISLPEVFANTVRNNMFVLRRPNLPVDTEELVRNSANNHKRNSSKCGPKTKKTNITLRGYESGISKIAAEFYLDYLSKNSKAPAKKILNGLIAERTGRKEEDVARAYSIDKIVTTSQKNMAKRAYRRHIQHENERKMDKSVLFR